MKAAPKVPYGTVSREHLRQLEELRTDNAFDGKPKKRSRKPAAKKGRYVIRIKYVLTYEIIHKGCSLLCTQKHAFYAVSDKEAKQKARKLAREEKRDANYFRLVDLVRVVTIYKENKHVRG